MHHCSLHTSARPKKLVNSLMQFIPPSWHDIGVERTGSNKECLFSPNSGVDRLGRNMYEFGAQVDHEKAFLFHFEDFAERI